MNITGIEILTSNIEATDRFYSVLLGLEKINAGAGSLSFKAGRSTLTFTESVKENSQYHFAFNIPCNKITEAANWLSARTKLISISPGNYIADFRHWNAEAVYFYDNNGNILEFIARYDLQNDSDKPFDISSVECISEIGLVADDPSSYAEQLVQQHAIPYFSRWTRTDDFIVLGDENGLLIIVKTGRKWYPTEDEAQKVYTRIACIVNKCVVKIELY
jgi:hypothetical protein